MRNIDPLQALAVCHLPEPHLVGRLAAAAIAQAELMTTLPELTYPSLDTVERLVRKVVGQSGRKARSFAKTVFDEAIRQGWVREDRRRRRRAGAQEWFDLKTAREALASVRAARAAGQEVRLRRDLRLFQVETDERWRPIVWKRLHWDYSRAEKAEG